MSSSRCPSKFVISLLHCSWTPEAHSVLSIAHSHRKWFKAVLALSGSMKRCSHNFGLSRKSQFMSKERYKGLRIPIKLQDKVNNELKKLIDEKHMINLSSCPDKYVISPIVVTVKKDQTIKLALNSKLLNKAIHNNKY